MQLYKKPLENQYTGCIPAHYLEIIFSNTENLLEINLQLFAELLKVEAGSQSVGLSFMKIINLLPQYNTYCTNQRHSIETVQKLQKTNQPFVDFTQVPSFPLPFPLPLFTSFPLLPFFPSFFPPYFLSCFISFLPFSPSASSLVPSILRAENTQLFYLSPFSSLSLPFFHTSRFSFLSYKSPF